MCNFPRAKIGTHQTLTVSLLFSFSTCLGRHRFSDDCRKPWLIQPWPPFLASASSFAFLCVRGSSELQRSHHTKWTKHQRCESKGFLGGARPVVSGVVSGWFPMVSACLLMVSAPRDLKIDTVFTGPSCSFDRAK